MYTIDGRFCHKSSAPQTVVVVFVHLTESFRNAARFLATLGTLFVKVFVNGEDAFSQNLDVVIDLHNYGALAGENLVDAYYTLLESVDF